MNLGLKFVTTGRRKTRAQCEGKVINISSNGVAFRTEAELSPGITVQASMEWPVALNGDCILRITMEGSVVRSGDGVAVMTIDRYEFRTSGRLVSPAADESNALKRSFAALTAAALEACPSM